MRAHSRVRQRGGRRDISICLQFCKMSAYAYIGRSRTGGSQYGRKRAVWNGEVAVIARRCARHPGAFCSSTIWRSAPSGLKVTQRAILARIGRSEPTSVGELADGLVMDAGGLAHTLKPLVRDGFVTIAPDPQDRRNRLVRLTSAGKAKLSGIRSAVANRTTRLRKGSSARPDRKLCTRLSGF